jgi:hypothetical protein
LRTLQCTPLMLRQHHHSTVNMVPCTYSQTCWWSTQLLHTASRACHNIPVTAIGRHISCLHSTSRRSRALLPTDSHGHPQAIQPAAWSLCFYFQALIMPTYTSGCQAEGSRALCHQT